MIWKSEEAIGIRSCLQYYEHCILMSIELQETPYSTWYHLYRRHVLFV
jgi:hypothetical protein